MAGTLSTKHLHIVTHSFLQLNETGIIHFTAEKTEAARN